MNPVPLFCKLHKHLGMADITKDICRYENCANVAIFNIDTGARHLSGIACARHKSPEYVDVKTGLCWTKNCNRAGLFNQPVCKRGIACEFHKTSEMTMVDGI